MKKMRKLGKNQKWILCLIKEGVPTQELTSVSGLNKQQVQNVIGSLVMRGLVDISISTESFEQEVEQEEIVEEVVVGEETQENEKVKEIYNFLKNDFSKSSWLLNMLSIRHQSFEVFKENLKDYYIKIVKSDRLSPMYDKHIFCSVLGYQKNALIRMIQASEEMQNELFQVCVEFISLTGTYRCITDLFYSNVYEKALKKMAEKYNLLVTGSAADFSAYSQQSQKEAFASKIGYKLTGNDKVDFRRQASLVHPDKKGGDTSLMQELNKLYSK